MSQRQPTLFEDRFLESFAGTTIFNDPKIAIMELIANSWDAGATEVKIEWPVEEGGKFSIEDNGHGMSESHFMSRFRTLAYDRIRGQGKYAEVPEDLRTHITQRPVFGKNGKGRLGAFSFGQSYEVSTWRNGSLNTFKVSKETNKLMYFLKVGDTEIKEGHGTIISVGNSILPNLTEEEVRKEIGMRFLTDPAFSVYVNTVQVSFEDIPEDNVQIIHSDVEGVGIFTIYSIDVQATDKTTQQHGIAWHVNKRLVGECTWKGSGSEHLVDGRRMVAKRFVFIIKADPLAQHVVPDWTTFYPTEPTVKKARAQLHEAIKAHLLEVTKGQREQIFDSIEEAVKPSLKGLGVAKREKWEIMMKEIQAECPSISEDDLFKLGKLLITLENSLHKYSLIHMLASSTHEELDNLTEILQKWDIDLAKVVLDEIEYRTTLLENLQIKVLNHHTDEVQELQPLFHRGLWIFGPEYETIEYTSNQGMTKVIQQLFGVDIKGSARRPDFAILPDSTVGLYSLPKYSSTDFGEIGIDRLSIVELKKPGIPISEEQKTQAWKYVKELLTKGLISKSTKVSCFVLGSIIDEHEAHPRYEENTSIYPMTYDLVVRRAKSRLLNLYDKISSSEFLQNTRIRQFLLEKSQQELFTSQELQL